MTYTPIHRGLTAPRTLRTARSVAPAVAAGIVAFLTLVGGAVAAEPADLTVFGALPAVEDVQISPDGRRLALIAAQGEQRSVVIETIATRMIEATLAAGDQKLRSVQWATDDFVILTSSSTTTLTLGGSRTEWLQALAFNLSTRKQTPLLEAPDAMNGMLGPPDIRLVGGRPVAFVQGLSRPDTRAVLFKVDVESGRTEPADQLTRNAVGWAVAQDGRPIATSTYESEAHRWNLNAKTARGWRRVHTQSADLEQPSLLGLGRDGDTIVALVDTGAGDAIRQYDLKSEVWGEPLTNDADASPVFDGTTHRLIGLHTLSADEDRYDFFASEDQAAWNAARAAYPEARVTLQSLSADHRKFVLLVEPSVSSPAYALIDLDARSAHWIAASYPRSVGLVSPTRTIAFTATDGLAITGYLTTPRGASPMQLPLVVLVHGGPAARDEPGFDWWVQALASRGYAVLRVNYRGSAGFGWSFQKAGFGEWGGRMQSDLSDGVRHLVSTGAVAANRVCIVGASYGGYAALAAATLEPGVWRCAAAIGGLSDLARFDRWVDTHDGPASRRYLERYWGAGLGGSRLSQLSPVEHAASVSGPILLVHGRDDTVVPFEQSQLMANALSRAGKPNELVILNREDHWLSRSDTRLEMLQAVVAFVERNNPPN